MASRRDRYPELGPKLKVSGFEAAMTKVREVWPGAYQEGSTGFERTWWSGRELVGHHWPVRARDPDTLWLRLRQREALS
ncbi:conserved hypothetical protein [Hyphomicrobiales bacterium]|jgi:hypothetical protein|nr:conserved hypothetical protein [Hyphomicrobiales bacterium]CAH1702795.1 conserved hypothetical protein [Hyphomicrobiales bacterium]CAI0346985.1 conserved hypothetical protein [Hyphomicrobiales bacterium]